MRFHREMAGHYYFEDKHSGEVYHIFKISRDCWGWNIGKSMTKGTFKSLKEAREYFKWWE